MSPLRIAVIGAGHLGKIHTRLLKSLPDVHVVAVADPQENARQEIEQLLQVNTVSDYHSLVKDIDAVVVASPTSLHYSMASWSLRNGLHTFVEKPLVKSSAEASELVDLADRFGCVLQVGHVERFNPAWKVAESYLQQPLRIDSIRESTYTGRSTDIGVVLDLMIHDLDLVLSLIDDDVREVQATGWALMGQHEDVAESRIVFENGAVANLRVSRASRQAIRRMQVYSQTAMADIDFNSASVDIVGQCPEIASRKFSAESLPTAERMKIKDELFTRWLPHQRIEAPPANAIQCELQDFVGCIREHRQPIVAGRDCIRTLQVIESVLSSIHLGSQESRRTGEPLLPFKSVARRTAA